MLTKILGKNFLKKVGQLISHKTVLPLCKSISHCFLQDMRTGSWSAAFLTFCLALSSIKSLEHNCTTTRVQAANCEIHICKEIGYRSFNGSRKFCQEHFEESDLVSFESENEFNYLLIILRSYRDPKLRFFPGIYQSPSNDQWHPETGKFYWITSGERLTNESETYWKPFDKWIEHFDSIEPVSEKQFQYYLMDSNGTAYPGQRFNGGILSEELADPYVVCKSNHSTKKEVTEKTEATSVTNETTNTSKSSTIVTSLVVTISIFAAIIISLAVTLVAMCKRLTNLHVQRKLIHAEMESLIVQSYSTMNEDHTNFF